MDHTAAALPIRGLTESEVRDRRARGLGNTSPPPTSRTYARIVRDNVLTFINVVLFMLGFGLVLVGRPTDALISVGIISINIVVSLVQEVRAKRILDRIALLTRPTATVVRDGQERTVLPDEVVVGDVLKISAGDQILVDGTVIGQGRMQVDESQLTGESDLISKEPGDAVYSGSFCVSGGAYCEAEKVGESSFANQLTAGARAFRRVLTPLQSQINLIIRVILAIVIWLEILLVADAAIKAIPFGEGVAQATVVAGLVPNGLLLTIAVAYALGAVRIVRLGALVQQSNAIESLSNVDVLCLDKTGTLTTNQLKLAELCAFGIAETELQDALGAMMASASARNATGDAIAQAIPAAARPLVGEVSFSSVRKWSAVAFDDDEFCGIYALGAPEMLRPFLGSAGHDASPVWHTISEQAFARAREGLRVLLVAHHPEPGRLRADQAGQADNPGPLGAAGAGLPHDMTPIGLVSLSDELRLEARETLAGFIRSGVHPKIISGDNPETVAALAVQAGMHPDTKLVSGPELDQMEEAQFTEVAVSTTIFGRITPQQKERLVQALRERGHYVAMIGDGVNDVLSLKKANLGIAMQSGSQATRGVADIVLMNDSFASLAPALAEGQRIVNGMQDILKLFVTRIAIMTLTILSALVIGLFPINLRHASVITLWTVGIPSVLLALWARPGYRYRHSLMRRLVHFALPAAVISSLLALIVFYVPLFYRAPRLGPEITESSPEFAGLILASQSLLASFLLLIGLLLLVFVEPPTRWWVGGDAYSGDWRPTLLAGGLLMAFIAVMAVPALRGFFALALLAPADILLVIAATLAWLILVRLVWRRRLLERFFGVE
jgi:cation-transporting ATPase E